MELNIHGLIRYLNRFDKAPRPMTLFLKDFFEDKRIIGCEIGVDAGRHSKSLLSNLNLSEFYLIDPYLPYDDYRREQLVHIGQKVQDKKKMKAMSRLNHLKNVKFIFEDSTVCHDSFPDDFFDFVYIDGNHSKEYIRADLYNYFKKVKPGGIIGGHDFSGTHIAVVREVLSFEKESGLDLTSSGIEWWFIKG